MASATATQTALPLSDLDKNRRNEIVGGLNASLAALVDLALGSKQAHWNVKGPNFQGLHELFDEIAVGVREYSDEVAERVRALGGLSRGTLNDVVNATSLPNFPASNTDWRELADAMHRRLITVSEDLRGRADGMEDDLVTQDLYIEVMRGLDKWAWMVGAHLE
jgi:starvation-inducible DNA-binding protein